MLAALTTISAPSSESEIERGDQGIEVVGVELYWNSGVISSNQVSGSYSGISAMLRFATLKWERFYWTILELGGGAIFYPRFGFVSFGGTEFGVPFYIGKTGRHSIRIGLGVGGGYTAIGYDGPEIPAGFLIYAIASPNLRYGFQATRRMFIGAGLRAFVGYGNLAMLSSYLEIGWSIANP